MKTHVDSSTRITAASMREAAVMDLIERDSIERGYSPSESLRIRFITQVTRSAYPRSTDEVLKDFRMAVTKEERQRSETKSAKREATKQRRSRRRKDELRRKTTRQNVGVTAGRQPRRGNMRLTRTPESEPALVTAA